MAGYDIGGTGPVEATTTSRVRRMPSALPVGPSVGASAANRVRGTQENFEAFALQTMIDEILPRETTELFGTGSAGRMWSSLLAEKLAAVISGGGRLRLVSDDAFARSAGERASNSTVEK